MRTMLISTVIILLSSLVIIDSTTSKTTKVGKAPLPDCDILYTCFVPAICIHDKGNNGAVKLQYYTNVNDDCKAIFRYQKLGDHHVRFSIESFDATTEFIYFYLTEKYQSTNPDTIKFECIMKGKDPPEAMYNGKKVDANDAISLDSRTKRNCSFEIKLRKGKKIFPKKEDPEYWMAFQISPKYNVIPDPKNWEKEEGFCDSSNQLKDDDNNPPDPYKKISKYVEKKGNYFCEKPDIFQLQYKKSTSNYEDIDTLECKGSKHFRIKQHNKYVIFSPGQNDDIETFLPKDDLIHVRCVADIRYFCKDIAAKFKDDEARLNYTPANITNKKVAELECPKEDPHLMIGDKLIRNAKFECKNVDGLPQWNIIGHEDMQLTQTGHEVYCTHKIQCSSENRIPDTAVEKGRLNKENIPECYERGVLRVGGKNISQPKCDEQTGFFKYSSENKEITIKGEIKFDCYYAPMVDTEKNDKNDKLIGIIGGVSIALVILLVLVFIFFAFRYSRKKFLKLKKEAKEKYEKDQKNFDRLCYNKNERQEGQGLPEEEEATPKSSDALADPSEWSAYIMNSLNEAAKVTGGPPKEDRSWTPSRIKSAKLTYDRFKETYSKNKSQDFIKKYKCDVTDLRAKYNITLKTAADDHLQLYQE